MLNEIIEPKSDLQKEVEKIRVEWAVSDKKRDEKLTVPENMRNHCDIPYGTHGTSNLLDIYMKADVKAPQKAIVNIHGGAWVYGSKEVLEFSFKS